MRGRGAPTRSGGYVSDAQRVIDAEVRTQVRLRGLDPVSQRSEVRAIVETVVAAYDQRSLVAALPPIDDIDALAHDVLDGV